MQMKLEAAKLGVVRSMFIHTADENYITARWCASNALHTDFLWLAFHSIEKYLKAALLLNGKNIQRSRHDIVSLFSDFCMALGEFAPIVLKKPQRLNMDWRDVEARDFVRSLARWGNPDGRYLVHGHSTDPEDVHRLDALVFAIRRVCHNLNAILLAGTTDQLSIGEALRENPELNLGQGLPFDRLITAKETPLRRAALNLNFAFAPAEYRHGADQRSSADHMSAIDTFFFEYLNSPDQEERDTAMELGRWLIDNIQLPPDLRVEIKRLI
jgi:hypothetical protein